MDAKLTQAVREQCEARQGLLFELLSRSIAVPSLSGEESAQTEVLARFFTEHRLPFARSPEGSLVAMLLPPIFAAPLVRAAEVPFERWCEIARDAVDLARRSATGNPSRETGFLAFNAHLDVVEAGNPASWTHDPFTATIVGERVYGRGTCDMKGALAAMAVSLVVGRDVVAAGFPLQMPVIACFVPEEERAEGYAFSKLLGPGGFRPTCVLLGEPSSGAVARGQRGKLELRLRVKGRRSHTSVPEAGESAATKMARVALVIDRYDRSERERVGTAPEAVLDRTTLALTALRTVPFNRSFVPDDAEAYVTGRLARGVTRASLLETLAQDPDWPRDLEVETTVAKQVSSKDGTEGPWLTEHPAWELPVDHSFSRRVAKAHAGLFGNEPEFIIWPFSTDGVASAGRCGIPTLGYGPGTPETAHIVDEYVEIEALMRAFMLYGVLPFTA